MHEFKPILIDLLDNRTSSELYRINANLDIALTTIKFDSINESGIAMVSNIIAIPFQTTDQSIPPFHVADLPINTVNPIIKSVMKAVNNVEIWDVMLNNYIIHMAKDNTRNIVNIDCAYLEDCINLKITIKIFIIDNVCVIQRNGVDYIYNVKLGWIERTSQ